MEWLYIAIAIVSGLGLIALIALGYWWIARSPGDAYIKDIWKFPPDG